MLFKREQARKPPTDCNPPQTVPKPAIWGPGALPRTVPRGIGAFRATLLEISREVNGEVSRCDFRRKRTRLGGFRRAECLSHVQSLSCGLGKLQRGNAIWRVII